MTTPMSTVSLNARIEKAVKDDLLDMCRHTKRSQSYYTEKVLVDFLAREKEYRKLVQVGIDCEGMIDDDDPRLDAWIDSIGTKDERPIPSPHISPGRLAEQSFSIKINKLKNIY